MSQKTFDKFISNEIEAATNQFKKKPEGDLHDIAKGQLVFLQSVRRVLDGTATWEDHGLHDAVNDVLQELGVLKTHETYVKMISK
ncbi:hypothetical protein E6B08_27335 [Pseudomonas putida]|uniref:Uncharacterized protein n=1 Tax=Pseudomonas putida TaxID=303 RepID=A0A4D6XJX4_PSEPU|nr:hypothetical protein [Pseudomonas putida]QCI14838.1 hypothetical protein E6B08_27335 [Pseudomonas putida]